MSGMLKNQSEYRIMCPICKQFFVPKFKIYTERVTEFLPDGKNGLNMQLLSPVVLHKEFINTLNKKGDSVLMSSSFIREHPVVYWNLVLYFKIMRLPHFILDHDTSTKHLKVQVSQIMKFLPSGSKANPMTVSRSSFGGSKTRLDKDNLKNLEKRAVQESPVRGNSISKVVAGISSVFSRGNSAKKNKGPTSNASGGEKESIRSSNVNTSTTGQQINLSAVKIPQGSRGSGTGSQMTTTSDVERMERL